MANRFYFSASCKANFPLLTDPNGLSSGSASCSSNGGHGQPLKEIHCTRIACTHPPAAAATGLDELLSDTLARTEPLACVANRFVPQSKRRV